MNKSTQKTEAQQPKLPDPQSLRPTDLNLGRGYLRGGDWMKAGSPLFMAGFEDDAVVCFAKHHVQSMGAAFAAKPSKQFEMAHTAELTSVGVVDFLGKAPSGRGEDLKALYESLIKDRAALESRAQETLRRHGIA